VHRCGREADGRLAIADVAGQKIRSDNQSMGRAKIDFFVMPSTAANVAST
jgi:hypothetical protein